MKRAVALLALVVALAAGCGGGDVGGDTAPTIPNDVAEDLAAQADAIAASYESGDVCGAAKQADSLNATVGDAIGAGHVPAELEDSLQATAIELVNEINCPAPAETTEEPSTTEEPLTTEEAPTSEEPPPDECALLDDERQALEAEIEDAEPKGQQKQLEKQLAALDELIAAACGDETEDDD